jgi:hypothetical protein
VDENGCILDVGAVPEHEHDSYDDAEMQRHTVSNAVKRKAVDDICEKPAKIICQYFVDDGDSVLLTKDDVRRIRKNMYVARRRKRKMALPKTIDDVNPFLQSLQLQTSEGEPFLLSKGTERIIFTCVSNLRFLCSVSHVFVDGTFKSAPKLFYQLFTIHAYKNGVYVPTVYMLLGGKKADEYKNAFKDVVQLCTENALTFNPTTLFADFEQAIHDGARSTWPTINVRGCRFHFAQSLWRKIQNLGLSTNYRDSDDASGKYLKTFFGLPFLSPADVLPFFTEYLLPSAPQNEKIDAWHEYLLRTYLQDDSLFPPDMWASFSSSLTRTTNACESMHAHLNSSFYTPHPNFDVFTTTLLRFQASTPLKIRSASTARLSSSPKELFVAQKMREYEAGSINVLQFVKAVCYKFLPKEKLRK